MYFRNTFQYANEVQSNDTRYATPKNYVSHVYGRTLANKWFHLKLLTFGSLSHKTLKIWMCTVFLNIKVSLEFCVTKITKLLTLPLSFTKLSGFEITQSREVW